MLTNVPVPPKSLADYAAVVGGEAIDRLRAAAEPFKGARLLHVNSTAFGGGVAELLYTQVPLYQDLGLDVEWRVIEGHEEFFTATKAMHNGLQGAEVAWTPSMERVHREVNEDNADAWARDYDFVVVHDPQPAALLSVLEARGRRAGRWIWRCHIDLTERFDPVWNYLRPLVEGFDATIFTLQDFVPSDLNTPHLELIPPSIDPLSLKNMPLDEEMVGAVIQRYALDPRRPLIVQVSRFDPWKDPLGVIDAYRIVKEDVPDVQLAMIASMATDDPEGWHWYTKTEEHRAGDPDIHLLSNLQEVGALAVNAFQRAADVVVQKSLREGFGLVVAEGMWKRKPVVAGNVGGIRLQIADGETGFLVDDVEQCAARVTKLLEDRDLADAIGTAARRRVRDEFLTMRSLSDYLALFGELSK